MCVCVRWRQWFRVIVVARFCVNQASLNLSSRAILITTRTSIRRQRRLCWPELCHTESVEMIVEIHSCRRHTPPSPPSCRGFDDMSFDNRVLCGINALVTCVIISAFVYVSGWNNFERISDVVTREIKHWNYFKIISKYFYFACNRVIITHHIQNDVFDNGQALLQIHDYSLNLFPKLPVSRISGLMTETQIVPGCTMWDVGFFLILGICIRLCVVSFWRKMNLEFIFTLGTMRQRNTLSTIDHYAASGS